VSGNKVGKLIVGRACQARSGSRVAEFVKRRDGQGQDLPVVAERVDRPPARIEVDEGRVFADPRPVAAYPLADRVA
jgi:hypothetical protein